MILHSTVLENGLKVYVHEVPHVRTVSVGVWVDQGSKDETDETSGVSHLIEHIMFNLPEGVQAENHLVGQLRNRGARFNATTTREFTYYFVALMSQYAALGFEALAAMVRQSELNLEVLERERQVVLHEHRMVMNSATQVTDRFAQSLWGDHYLGRMVIGQEEVVRSVSAHQIQAFLDSRYRPDNAGLVVVGGIRYSDAMQLAETHFGSWEPGARRSRPQALRYENNVVLIASDSDEVSLCFGVNGVADSDPDRHAVELLALVLGGSDQSRLYQEIRQKRSLAYVVSAYSNFYEPGGLLSGMVRCHRKDFAEVIRIMANEYSKLKTEPVSPQEITHSQEACRTETYMQTENSMQLMRLIGRNAMLGKNYSINAHLRAMQAVESADILAAANRLFCKRNLGLAVVGNVNEDELLNVLAECEL